MDKKTTHSFLLVGFGVGLYALLMNLKDVFEFAFSVLATLSPVFFGGIIAFILNVPMRFFERSLLRAFGRSKSSSPSRTIGFLSLLLTLSCVGIVLALTVTMLIPATVASVSSLRSVTEAKLPELSGMLAVYGIDAKLLRQFTESFELDTVLNHFVGGAGDFLNSAVGIVANAVSCAADLVISVVVAVYILLSKQGIARFGKRILISLFGKRRADRIVHVATVVRDTYSKFLSGQCAEACILGALICVFLALFSVPYAALIGLMCGIMSFVPYVGGIIAGGVGTLLVGFTDPEKIMTCVIVYAVVQFVENQLIYPHVVGNSVGLGALWTFFAAVLGGRLFGVLGMISFIPLAAVIRKLASECVIGE